MDITGNAEQLLDFKIPGNSFVSAPASAAPTNTVSTVIPVANWRGQIYIGGTAASNQVFQIGEWALNSQAPASGLLDGAGDRKIRI